MVSLAAMAARHMLPATLLPQPAIKRPCSTFLAGTNHSLDRLSPGRYRVTSASRIDHIRCDMSLLFWVAIAGLAFNTGLYAAEKDSTPINTTYSVPYLVLSSKPAVDGSSYKVQIYGGATQAELATITGLGSALPVALNDQTYWTGFGGGIGSATMPITHNIGTQLDMGSNLFGSSVSGTAAGHLFWRDPEIGLVGSYGSGLYNSISNGNSVWQAAGEFERYDGRFTLQALVGVQGFSNYSAPSSISFLNRNYIGYCPNPNRFVDDVSLKYYPTEDISFSIGHIYTRGNNSAYIATEYLFSEIKPLGAQVGGFFEASYGSNNSSTFLAGLKFYFNNSTKTLIRIQRENDHQAHDMLTIKNNSAPRQKPALSDILGVVPSADGC